ncbi:protein kinase C-binding protein 1-like [Tetranychus urticae]|uniref:Uncharacterized protein n=1 Tax=Tetranychus urticae TaxID=32264 RepID=T1KGT8_TETUR|nr:protein kinase C-binding protein 1-like [Tetranychus urticae]
MLGTEFLLYKQRAEQPMDKAYALRCGRAICWLCHSEWASVGCNHCFRYFHHKCAASDYRVGRQLTFYKDSAGVTLFTTQCNECVIAAVTHERWDKGLDFKKMPQKNVHRLIESIWQRIVWTITPTISATVAELPQTWVNCPVNFDIIDCKVKNGLYQYPYQLLNDLSLINHSLRIAHRDYNFSQYLINFMANIYSLFNRCEACPYCLESSFSDRPNWITETCPWGHPLIFVNLRDQSWPGKLLRYHHQSKLVDVLIFGSHEWYQVHASDCHHFVTTDYAIPYVSPSSKKAILESLRYLRNIVYCFPTKITLNCGTLYPDIADFLVISREQPNGSKNSTNHDKWISERVASTVHFINTMLTHVEQAQYTQDKYSKAAMDAKYLLTIVDEDSDSNDRGDNEIIVEN